MPSLLQSPAHVNKGRPLHRARTSLVPYQVVPTREYVQCTVFRKAYILSGSGFHEFLYSIIESFKKNREIAEFIPNQLRFHEKKL